MFDTLPFSASQVEHTRLSVSFLLGVRAFSRFQFQINSNPYLVAHNLGSETKRATGIPMFMSIGQCGSVLGSHLFPSTQGPKYMSVSFFSDSWTNSHSDAEKVLPFSARSSSSLLSVP
jgi:hypothetical protein